MSKDKRSDRKRCLRCTQWAEYGSELCADCEQDALDDMRDDATEDWDFHGGISVDALNATHFGGLKWEPSSVVYQKEISGTWTPTEYEDLLDQVRAESMVGE